MDVGQGSIDFDSAVEKSVVSGLKVWMAAGVQGLMGLPENLLAKFVVLVLKNLARVRTARGERVEGW